MMAENETPNDERINELIAEYLRAVEAGRTPDPDEFVSSHPEMAAELRAFLADREQFHQFVEPVQQVAPAGARKPAVAKPDDTDRMAQTLAPHDATAAIEPLGTVRYFGDYELLEEIARGGMGVVYKARQVNLNRTVALKMILAGQLASAEDVRRFYAEAEAAAKLDHPGIVPIFEVGEYDGQHYFSMAFVDGQSLAHRVLNGVLPPREAAALMKRVTEAISYAHIEGVIHRDLKPANVLIDRDGQPRVTDFGLAKRVQTEDEGHGAASLSQLTATGQVLGTPSYMPPEQASGTTKEIGPLSDIYSLGAILYCLVTGRPPFQAASPVDTLMQVLEQEPVSPRQLNPTVPRDLETISLKCLEKEPRKRYASAQELVDELQRFLSGEPIHARPVGSAERAWRWCRRNPRVASLSAAVLLLLVATAVVSSAAAVRIRQENLRTVAAYRAEQLAKQEAHDAEQVARNSEQQARTAEQQARDAEEKALDELYFNQVNLAHRYWYDNDVAAAEKLLDAATPPRRSWEWHYLKRLGHADLMTLRGQGQTGAPHVVAFSPDGKLIAAAGGRGDGPDEHGELRIWDAATGREIRRITGHSSLVTGLVFTPDPDADGRRIISGSEDKTLKMWDVATGREVAVFFGHKFPVKGIALSPDGKRIASVAAALVFHEPGEKAIADRAVESKRIVGELKIWDAETGDALHTIEQNYRLLSVAFSPDGSRVAVAGQGSGKIIETETAKEIQALSGSSDLSIAWSPDGKYVATPTSDGFELWDAATGKMLRTNSGGHKRFVRSLVFSPNSRQLATAAADRTARLWDVTSGEELGVFRGHTADLTSVAFSPDGKRIATASMDQTLKVWESAHGQEATDFGTNFGIVRSVRFSRDNRWVIAAAGGGRIVIRDATTGQYLVSFDHPGASSAEFMPDGSRLVTGGFDTNLKIWDLAGIAEKPPGAFLPSNQRLLQTLRGHSDNIADVAVSPDGRQIASASWDATVRVWDAADGKELFQSNVGFQAYGVAFSPDGKQLAVTSGTALTILDASDGRQLRRVEAGGGRGGVISLAFSPDGQYLAFNIAGEVRVCEAATGRTLRALPITVQSHDGDGLAFTRDGRRLVAASGDGAIKFWDWDSDSAREALTLRGHAGESMAFSPDGHRLVTCGGETTIRIWDATPMEK